MPRCEKKRFSSRAAAKKHERRWRGKNGRQRPYRCLERECRAGGYWHLATDSAAHTAWYKDKRANPAKDHNDWRSL